MATAGTMRTKKEGATAMKSPVGRMESKVLKSRGMVPRRNKPAAPPFIESENKGEPHRGVWRVSMKRPPD
jgi:hypothetical protein